MRSNNSRNLTVILLGFIALYAFLTLNKISKLVKERIIDNQLAAITLIVEPKIDPVTKQAIPITKEAMESTKSILEKRFSSISELKFTMNINGNKISISMPKLPKEESLRIVQSFIAKTKFSIHSIHKQSDQIIDDVLQGKEIPGYKALPHTTTNTSSGEKTISHILIKNEAIIDKTDIKTAWISPQDNSVINIELNDDGGKKMNEHTLSLTPQIDRLATVLNGKVLNTATLNTAPLGKHFTITGINTKQEAEAIISSLQNLLKYDIKIVK